MLLIQFNYLHSLSLRYRYNLYDVHLHMCINAYLIQLHYAVFITHCNVRRSSVQKSS